MSDCDPFAPKSVVTPKRPRVSLDHPPLDQMRKLGASTVVLAELSRRWELLDGAERRHAFDDLDAMADDELRRAFDEMEVEAVAAQAWPGANEEKLAQAALALSAVPDGTVKEILGWVDGQPDRALAALTVEYRQPPNQQRSTLVEAMEAVLRGH